MNCKYYKTRSKKYKKYGYCIKYKKEVILFCKECEKIEYKTNTTKSKVKSARTKATDIPLSVKKRVWQRDKGKCVICGNSFNVMPNAHYIRRSKGGLGIEQNIFTACTDLTPNKCHSNFDNFGIGKEKVINHFKLFYPNWSEEKLYYKKH